jgi:hypothetical protein
VGTPSCWFNPSAFAVPPAGEFGNAGRNILRGPAFAQFDASLHKDFAIAERRKITVGVEAYNLFNHPNFGVPSNTQSPLSLGGNGDAVFKDAAGNFAANAGQILTTAGTAPDSTGRPVYVLKGARKPSDQSSHVDRRLRSVSHHGADTPRHISFLPEWISGSVQPWRRVRSQWQQHLCTF